jgi:hypothetical protein
VDIRGDVNTEVFDTFLQEFSKDMDREAKGNFLRATALEFIKTVVPLTPVDFGQARAGWAAASYRLSAGLRFSGQKAAEGRRQGTYTERINKGDRQFIEIGNGVEHIEYLEMGSSQQAPSGMVRLSLRKIVAKARGEAHRSVEAAIRAANIKARRAIGLRQGKSKRIGPGTRQNIARR